jgi:hypothetical protein
MHRRRFRGGCDTYRDLRQENRYCKVRRKKKRIIEERDELLVKHQKLIEFISSDAFDEVDMSEQQRLRRQRHIMELYLMVLNERIENF